MIFVLIMRMAYEDTFRQHLKLCVLTPVYFNVFMRSGCAVYVDVFVRQEGILKSCCSDYVNGNPLSSHSQSG